MKQSLSDSSYFVKKYKQMFADNIVEVEENDNVEETLGIHFIRNIVYVQN